MNRNRPTHPAPESVEHAVSSTAPRKAVSKRRRRWRRILIILSVLVLLLVIGRLCLPWIVRDYVNRTLDRNQLYSGQIGEVKIHLWRGAYSIQDIQISKRTGNVPVPFFSAKRLDFAIQWDAL